MPRDYMIAYRARKRLSVAEMAARCEVSPALIRILEENENSVTHPEIAARVGAEYELSRRRTLMMMPEHHRPGKNYEPDRYKNTEDLEDIFRAFKVSRLGKGGAAV